MVNKLNISVGRLLRAALLLLALAIVQESRSALAQGSTATPTPFPLGTPAAAPTAGGATIHVVQRNDTVFHIAQQYGTTVDAIVSANGLSDPTQIQIGQRLLIPGVTVDPAQGDDSRPPDSGDSPANAGQPGSPTTYIVQPSDSLYSLSWRYSMDVNAIARQNKIVNPLQALYVGESISLQEGANNLAPVKTGSAYTVQPNDTIYRVALRYGVSVDALLKANQLGRIPVVYAGQRLVIPAAPNGPTLVDVPAAFSQIGITPLQPQQGRTFELFITTTNAAKLAGHFMGKELMIASDAARTRHMILYGIDAFAKHGTYPLDLTATDDAGKPTTFARNILVSDGGYPSEQITLPADQLDLLDPKVTQPELNHVLGIVTKYTQQSFLKGPMGLPCAAPITSQFGTRRAYNGGPYAQWHAGTDFAALPGAPIYAPRGGGEAT